jgi:small subunit ribosomal protein S6
LREYETILVLHPSLDEDEVASQIKTVEEIIGAGGGEVVNVERWGRRRLAYEIQKAQEGIYSVIRFAGNAEILREMERRYRMNEKLLRHLTVIADEPLPAAEGAAGEAATEQPGDGSTEPAPPAAGQTEQSRDGRQGVARPADPAPAGVRPPGEPASSGEPTPEDPRR